MTRYQGKQKASEGVWEVGGEGADVLEELARRGAQEMLRRALEEEVEAFLGRGRHERTETFRGYRNG